MNARLLRPACLAAVALGLFASAARAQTAAPPLGTWQGRGDDGVLVVLDVQNYQFVLSVPPGGPMIAGPWAWRPASPTEGTLTVYGAFAPYVQDYDYHVKWLGPALFELSDPSLRVVFSRTE